MNEKIYQQEVNQSLAYRISVEDFNNWLVESNQMANFIREIRQWLTEDDTEHLYEIAIVYSVPVVMVKRFVPFALVF